MTGAWRCWREAVLFSAIYGCRFSICRRWAINRWQLRTKRPGLSITARYTTFAKSRPSCRVLAGYFAAIRTLRSYLRHTVNGGLRQSIVFAGCSPLRYGMRLKTYCIYAVIDLAL